MFINGAHYSRSPIDNATKVLAKKGRIERGRREERSSVKLVGCPACRSLDLPWVTSEGIFLRNEDLLFKKKILDREIME